jgi:acyl-[acyl carrier protein]--UDP-N-acetylglucosamine O-acyltransferase
MDNNVIDPSAIIDETVEMGNFNVIFPGVNVGKDTVIENFVEIMANTRIGANCFPSDMIGS